MISVQRKFIHKLPVLELVESDKINEKLPLAIFFHGITGQKERGLEPGYELAKQGMRVVIPDAFLHGERKKETFNGKKEMEFWTIVMHSVEELPFIVDHYITEKLALANRVFVTGLSMGAITTCMAFVKYPWIHAAGSLMGNPDPIGFTDWILTSRWMQGIEGIDKEEALKLMEPFKQLSLKEAPSKIAGRPFYVWHGTADESVPFEQMDEFISEIQGEPYAENINYEFYEGHGHKVPYEVFEKMAVYLGAQ